MYLPRAKPARSLIIALVVFVGGLIFFWQQHPVLSSSRPGLLTEHTNDEFWKSISALLAAATPRCRPPKKKCTAKPIGWGDVHSTPNTKPQECLSMPESSIQAMRESHQTYVQGITTSPPKMSYIPETTGLVTTAGTDYLPHVIISLRMLRKTGCTLPMEVFLSTTHDYEPHICTTILPSLNARCILQSPHFHTTANTDPPSRYQSKILAILTSTFSSLLFLDADSFPITDPSPIFTHPVFTTTGGLLTFPDYWATTASPLYYAITQTPFPPLTLHQTTESGQLFISKPHHESSLLLALYYNHFGKKFYYPLLSQGASGEGDKDTFLAAASFFNESYYQVRTPVRSLGHMVNGHLDGSAMIQYNPIDDYNYNLSLSLPASDSDSISKPKPMSIHNNFPKLNPRLLWTEHAHIITDPSTGAFRRPWTAEKEVLDSFGFDVQRSLWEEILWVACQLEGGFWAWEGVEGICKNTRAYWEEVFGGEGG